MSVCRAFVTSESAEAHRKLFEEIDVIVKLDTAHSLKVHYMHGEGWQVITMDEHKGQALGELISIEDYAISCPGAVTDYLPRFNYNRVRAISQRRCSRWWKSSLSLLPCSFSPPFAV